MRARDIVRARWRGGGAPLALDTVPGIGEVTSRRVAAWLEEHR